MNGHAVMFNRLLRVGEEWSQEDRIRQAITTMTGQIPLMFGLRKDHRIVPVERRTKGPPTRPVCGASSSINGPLSHTISEILVRLPDELKFRNRQ